MILERVYASLNEYSAFMESRHDDWVNVSWCKPPLGHHKINTDGSVLESGSAACGGVIRNDEGSLAPLDIAVLIRLSYEAFCVLWSWLVAWSFGTSLWKRILCLLVMQSSTDSLIV